MRTKLDCDTHDLLDEANVLLLTRRPDVRQTTALIGKLRDCADAARDDGHAEVEQRLRSAADDLERHLFKH
jgi:hypothetical protein